MIVMTGMHGNEPAGPRAGQRVLDRLESKGIELRGRFVVFAGNLKALAEHTRFLDRDLNRQWTPEKLVAIENGANHAEAEEQRELLSAMRAELDGIEGPVYFLDLHTTSAASPPFLTVGDTLRNRAFARTFPLPLILGLEEQVDGALLEFLNNFGLITMGAEAGQHDCDGSVDRGEAILWWALHSTGMAPQATNVTPYAEVLRETSRGVPSVVEVRYRHAITEEDEFQMIPGFDNFAPVRKGEVVAHDRNGPVHAKETGLMLLPLYQGKGEDGFFIARPVRMFWLRLSSFLRRLRLDSVLPWLPGVHSSGAGRLELTIDTKIARWWPLDVLHLFGYRKQRVVGDALIVTRRAFDFDGPGKIRVWDPPGG